MEIEFDLIKDRENRRAHGYSLSYAKELFWDLSYGWPDRRFHYEEVRMNALAPSDTGLFWVAYVERENRMRIISLRKAKNKERRFYARVCSLT